MARIENKVGHALPTSQEAAKLVKSLQTLVEALKEFGVILDGDERKRLLHARKDPNQHVQRVHDLAAEYNVAIPDVPLQGMQDDLTLYRLLQPITDLVHAAVVLVDDTEGQAESEMWQAFLAYYAVLSTMATRNAELAVKLEPTRAWMASRRRASGGGQGGGGGPSPT